MSTMRDKYVREKQPPIQVEVDLGAIVGRTPLTARPRLTTGIRAWGLRTGEWVPGLLLRWRQSAITGEWLAVVEYHVPTGNNIEVETLRSLVPRNAVRLPERAKTREAGHTERESSGS